MHGAERVGKLCFIRCNVLYRLPNNYLNQSFSLRIREFFNLFIPNAPFLYSLKTSENRKVC